MDKGIKKRKILNELILMRAGFPPAIILKNDPKKYYDTLNKANNGNYYSLLLLMIQSIERRLNIYFSSMPGTDSDYLSIHSIVSEPQSPYDQEYISLLVRTRKIDAFKEGKNWFTSKKAIAGYVE